MAKKRVKKKTSPKNTKPNRAPKKRKISEALAIVSLILNILIMPGLGTLIAGKKREGIWQLILLFGGFLLGLFLTITIIGALVGIPLMIGGPLAAWIWGIVSGVEIIQTAEK